MKYILSILFFFVSFYSLNSCTGGHTSQSLSAQERSTDVSIRRFDVDLFNLLQERSEQQENSIKTHYPDFLNAFGAVTINQSDSDNPAFFPALEQYFSNEMLQSIYKDALDTFKTLQPYEEELTQARDLIGKYFEEKSLPSLCMHVSGFKANTIVLEDMISISADKYLGKDYPAYKQFFEGYQLIQMQPKMIVRDYLKAWIIGEIPTNNKRKDLLAEMINQGKILYALQQLLPERNEADLIGYTQEQMDWVKENEKKIWKITIEHNYLYNTEHLTIKKYMDEAPYTATISTESPGRLGDWIGWQIVKKYAENSKKDLVSILNETDSQSILKASKYNP